MRLMKYSNLRLKFNAAMVRAGLELVIFRLQSEVYRRGLRSRSYFAKIYSQVQHCKLAQHPVCIVWPHIYISSSGATFFYYN